MSNSESNKQVAGSHTPGPVNQQLLAALKLALSSNGKMLLTNPPQDAWRYNRVDEVSRAAIAAAEAAQPVVLQQTVSVTDERTAFEAWLQEGIDGTDTVRPSDDKVDAYFAVWLARATLNVQTTNADTELALFAENQKRADVERERDQLRGALELMLERVQEPPEANCSCHLSPPCNDCIEYGGEREAFESAKDAIAAVKSGA